jgi:signal transduction histidine kinase
MQVSRDLLTHPTAQYKTWTTEIQLWLAGRGAGGAGLGLSIAQWIVKEHKGSIEVQSRPGQGSTFKVTIPMADGIT